MAIDISHANVPEAYLHETKGASTATAGQVLTATGAGTATFQTPAVTRLHIEDVLTTGKAATDIVSSDSPIITLRWDAATSPNNNISVTGSTVTFIKDGVYEVTFVGGSRGYDRQSAAYYSGYNIPVIAGTRYYEHGVSNGKPSSFLIEVTAGTTMNFICHTGGTTDIDEHYHSLDKLTLTDSDGATPYTIKTQKLSIKKLSI